MMVKSELLAAKRLIVFRGEEEADEDVTVPFDIMPLVPLLPCGGGGDFSAL